MPLALLVLSALLALGVPTAAAGPAWTWPVPGAPQVTRDFAPGPTPYSPGHRGADLPAPAGSPVRAASAGRVTYAGLLAGRGVVVVTHGALRTTYEPVVAVVRAGEQVDAGAVLGTLAAGHAGCPAEACLHWGLRRGEVSLDPVRLVLGGAVRLLPLGGAAPVRGAGPGAVGAVLVPPPVVGAGPGPGGPAPGPGGAGRPRPVAAAGSPPPGTGVPLAVGLAGAAAAMAARRRRT